MLDDEHELPSVPVRFLGTMAIYPNGEVSILLPDGTMGWKRDVGAALGLERAIEDIAHAVESADLNAQQLALLENYRQTPSLLAEDVAEYLTEHTAAQRGPGRR